MKESSRISASHVNAGTSFSRCELDSTKQRGREFRHPKLTAELEESESTAFGGIGLAACLSAALRLPQRLDAGLSLLKSSRPYRESDHVLTHVYNMFSGGTCIEDISNLQCSEPIRRILGAERIPDPTTAGDFLRRFTERDLKDFYKIQDELQAEVWRRRYGRKKPALGIVDVDSHVKVVYGSKKAGADFTYQGSYGYHPLLLTLAESQECLRAINRPGNVQSSEGAAEQLKEVLPGLSRRFKRILVRGDSAFAIRSIYAACEEHGAYFAFVCKEWRNLPRLADSVLEKEWKPFRTKPSASKISPRRKRRKNLRRKKARARGKRDLKLERQWVAEVRYKPAKHKQILRLIIRRQRIEESRQGELFVIWRYRYVISNLPSSYSTEQVVRLTYRRCDQENVIEQLQNGIAAMRMPTGSFLANSAFLACAGLAHNFKAWLAQLALPLETMRWEWKRFRLAYVYLAARVVRKARQTIIRFANSHRFARQAAEGVSRLNL